MSLISVLGKKWVLRKFNNEDINFFKENFFLDTTVSKLLSIRGIPKNEVELFLNPSLKNILPNPNILKDMDTATDRAFNSIREGEPIGIFGDYDVDGASSTALLGNFFKEIKHKYEIYIPDRKTEGYGPTIKGLKKILDSSSNNDILNLDEISNNSIRANDFKNKVLKISKIVKNLKIYK